MIKNSINLEQRGRVMTWEKHQKEAAQRELEAAIRGTRSLPGNNVGAVHNFQDVLTKELDQFVPGGAYFRRRAEQKLGNRTNKIASCKFQSMKILQLTFNKQEILCSSVSDIRDTRLNYLITNLDMYLLFFL